MYLWHLFTHIRNFIPELALKFMQAKADIGSFCLTAGVSSSSTIQPKSCGVGTFQGVEVEFNNLVLDYGHALPLLWHGIPLVPEVVQRNRISIAEPFLPYSIAIVATICPRAGQDPSQSGQHTLSLSCPFLCLSGHNDWEVLFAANSVTENSWMMAWTSAVGSKELLERRSQVFQVPVNATTNMCNSIQKCKELGERAFSWFLRFWDAVHD